MRHIHYFFALRRIPLIAIALFSVLGINLIGFRGTLRYKLGQFWILADCPAEPDGHFRQLSGGNVAYDVVHAEYVTCVLGSLLLSVSATRQP